MFFLNHQKPPFQKIDLLSVHIPKTAGMSFLNVLEGLYREKLYKVYHPRLLARVNEGRLHKLPGQVTALHGHYEVNRHTRKLFPDAKIICWLRHPAARVISHYHYWLTYPEHGNPFHHKFLQEKPGLLEFIQDPVYGRTVNAYQAFLGDIDPAEFFFIGRTEFFANDLISLFRLMGWNQENFTVPRENFRPYKAPVTEDLLQKIESALAPETALYKNLISRFHTTHSSS